MTLAAPYANAHRQDHGGYYPHTGGTNLYLPYAHMNAGYTADMDAAMLAWYNTPTRVWPYVSTDTRTTKVDVYTAFYNTTWFGMAVNFNSSGQECTNCVYSWTNVYMNRSTLDRESSSHRRKVAAHEVGHAMGLSHVPSTDTTTRSIMRQGYLPYNLPQTHDVNDINAIYR
jgi:predicted Zn-dependent protease